MEWGGGGGLQKQDRTSTGFGAHSDVGRSERERAKIPLRFKTWKTGWWFHECTKEHKKRIKSGKKKRHIQLHPPIK